MQIFKELFALKLQYIPADPDADVRREPDLTACGIGPVSDL